MAPTQHLSLLFPPLNKSSAWWNRSALSISSRNIPSPGPQRAVMRGKHRRVKLFNKLAGVTQREGPPEDPRPPAQHPGGLLARSRPDFLAPPASSAKPPQGQLPKGAEGSGAGRRLLRAAPSAVAGEEARAHPTFGCPPSGQGNLGRPAGSDPEPSGNRAARPAGEGSLESSGQRRAARFPTARSPSPSLGIAAAGLGAASSRVAATWPRGRRRP